MRRIFLFVTADRDRGEISKLPTRMWVSDADWSYLLSGVGHTCSPELRCPWTSTAWAPHLVANQLDASHAHANSPSARALKWQLPAHLARQTRLGGRFAGIRP